MFCWCKTTVKDCSSITSWSSSQKGDAFSHVPAGSRVPSKAGMSSTGVERGQGGVEQGEGGQQWGQVDGVSLHGGRISSAGACHFLSPSLA